MFQSIPTAPPDSILGLTEIFNRDDRPNKVNLTVGVYKDEQGTTPILKSVKEAERRLLEIEKSKGYLGIEGHPEYLNQVIDLTFGSAVVADRIAAAQTPGGTGALRVASEMVAKHFPGTRIWVSNPTWANHQAIFRSAGLDVATYPYLADDQTSLDLPAMLEHLKTHGRPTDLVCLHACCHNPTGIDPTTEDWKQIASVLAEKSMIPLIDFAYQGFGEGLDQDRQGIHTLLAECPESIVCSSYSKNFGLYSERVGAAFVVSESAASQPAVLSQLKQSVRSNYSNPPRHGAATVATVLADGQLRDLWEQEVADMRDRIAAMRETLVQRLSETGCSKDFSFLLNQKGMFSYTGLTPLQADWLKSNKAIYLVGTGRINVAGISSSNIDYLCQSIAECIAETCSST